MKTKVLMIAVLLGCTALVMAQPNGNGTKKSARGTGHEVRMNEQRGPGDGLDLTDAQKEVFKQTMLALQKQLQPIRNEIGEAEARQKTLVTIDKPDMADINKNIEKIGGLKTEMAKIQAKHRIEMRAQLSDEQRIKFDLHPGKMKHGKGQKGMEHGDRMKG